MTHNTPHFIKAYKIPAYFPKSHLYENDEEPNCFNSSHAKIMFQDPDFNLYESTIQTPINTHAIEHRLRNFVTPPNRPHESAVFFLLAWKSPV